jgi:hypothetical protein
MIAPCVFSSLGQKLPQAALTFDQTDVGIFVTERLTVVRLMI